MAERGFINMTRSSELFNRAKSVMPGGVSSPVRAFKSVGGNPPFISSANGCILTDVDGKEYIDYIGSWGPMILGHGHPEVLRLLSLAVETGCSFGAPSSGEVELAELIVDRIPSIDKIRFVNSGTEATMSALRLARAATNREVIIKFAGCYHGHADAFLIQAGSGVATFGLPDSPGVTKGAAKDTRVARYNDIPSVRAILEGDDKGNVAGIIVEPVAGNMGVVPPSKGFLQGLRELCDEHDSLLILDEVMTGFRVAKGGAQDLYNIKPDLTTFGKIIGGGLPVGAYGGKGDLMEMIAPEGPVYQAGTLSGNPLAMSAGIATLQNLNSDVYANIEKMSARLEAGILKALDDNGIKGTVQRVGSMLTLFFGQENVYNMEDASACNHKHFSLFFQKMLAKGIHLPPSGYEAWFISASHNQEAIDKTISAVSDSL
jgi:glutamate-1-semialdehyde 2,1-aminomutase